MKNKRAQALSVSHSLRASQIRCQHPFFRSVRNRARLQENQESSSCGITPFINLCNYSMHSPACQEIKKSLVFSVQIEYDIG